MRRALLIGLTACAGFTLLGGQVLHAQQRTVPGILAGQETQALSYEDKLAARTAEQQALDRDEPVKSFEWHGPDGARGIIMISGEYANHVAMGRCRHFVHIIRHKDDGGVNPTFIGVVCRDWEGHWQARRP